MGCNISKRTRHPQLDHPQQQSEKDIKTNAAPRLSNLSFSSHEKPSSASNRASTIVTSPPQSKLTLQQGHDVSTQHIEVDTRLEDFKRMSIIDVGYQKSELMPHQRSDVSRRHSNDSSTIEVAQLNQSVVDIQPDIQFEVQPDLQPSNANNSNNADKIDTINLTTQGPPTTKTPPDALLLPAEEVEPIHIHSASQSSPTTQAKPEVLVLPTETVVAPILTRTASQHSVHLPPTISVVHPAQTESLKTFHLFSKLPHEIQVRIWSWCLPGPQVVEIENCNQCRPWGLGQWFTPEESYVLDPSTLDLQLASKDFRELFTKSWRPFCPIVQHDHHTFWETYDCPLDQEIPKQISYFNPDIDTLYITHSHHSPGSSSLPKTLLKLKTHDALQGLRYLAIMSEQWYGWEAAVRTRPTSSFSTKEDLLLAFPSLEKFTRVVNDQIMNYVHGDLGYERPKMRGAINLRDISKKELLEIGWKEPAEQNVFEDKIPRWSKPVLSKDITRGLVRPYDVPGCR